MEKHLKGTTKKVVQQHSLHKVIPSLTDAMEKTHKAKNGEEKLQKHKEKKKMHPIKGGRKCVGGNVISVVHRGREMFK